MIITIGAHTLPLFRTAIFFFPSAIYDSFVSWAATLIIFFFFFCACIRAFAYALPFWTNYLKTILVNTFDIRNRFFFLWTPLYGYWFIYYYGLFTATGLPTGCPGHLILSLPMNNFRAGFSLYIASFSVCILKCISFAWSLSYDLQLIDIQPFFNCPNSSRWYGSEPEINIFHGKLLAALGCWCYGVAIVALQYCGVASVMALRLCGFAAFFPN